MTKDEIKKALLYCQDYDCNSCEDCPYYTHLEDCINYILKDALNLITEQEQEIEQLRTTLGQCNTELNSALESLKSQCREIGELKAGTKQAKIDVLTELRNKCHNYYPSIDHYCCSVKAVNLSDINKMIEELDK